MPVRLINNGQNNSVNNKNLLDGSISGTSNPNNQNQNIATLYANSVSVRYFGQKLRIQLIVKLFLY